MRLIWACTTMALCMMVTPGCGRKAGRVQDRAMRSGNSTQGVVSGNVRYGSSIELPPDAEVYVSLEDVSRGDGAGTVVSTQTIVTGGRQVPIAFELPYDSGKIDPRHRYGVRAQIRRRDGELMFRTATVSPVLTQGAPAEIDLTLESVGEEGAGSGADAGMHGRGGMSTTRGD